MKRMRRKLIVLVVLLSLMMPIVSSAASNRVRANVYNDVIKKGNTVFCAGKSGIYKVKVSRHKVVPKSRKCLRKVENPFFEGYASMRTYRNRLFFIQYGSSTCIKVLSTNFNGKKTIDYSRKGSIGYTEGEYVVSKGKVYITEERSSGLKKWVMSSTGKNKKGTKYIATPVRKNSNAKGYSLKTNYKNGYYYDYLKTPKGTYYLGKVKDY